MPGERGRKERGGSREREARGGERRLEIRLEGIAPLHVHILNLPLLESVR